MKKNYLHQLIIEKSKVVVSFEEIEQRLELAQREAQHLRDHNEYLRKRHEEDHQEIMQLLNYNAYVHQELTMLKGSYSELQRDRLELCKKLENIEFRNEQYEKLQQ